MTALTADPALPASQQLHTEQGEQTGDKVIQHDAEPAMTAVTADPPYQQASNCMQSRANRPAMRSSSMMPSPP